MITHEPDNYVCPFCSWLDGNETERKQNSDIVYQTSEITAFIAPKWWVNNPGHVIVIPNRHHENIYDIPEATLGLVYAAAKQSAIAMRDTYGCTGTSMRQHNEPDGNQDVWHFHVHVFPRYKDDHLYENHENKKYVSPEERKVFADKLKTRFEHMTKRQSTREH